MKESPCGGKTPTTTPTGGCVTRCSGRSRDLIDKLYPVFTEEVLSRLEVGAVEYGDKSLDADSAKLLGEIEQEMFDVMGWGFLLWNRIQNLKAKLATIETRASTLP